MTRNRYLRYLIAPAIGLGLCWPVWSAEISSEQAKTAVANWARQVPHPLGAKLGQTVRSARTFSDKEGNALFHVVRFQEGGYAVAAADDGILPIIAFSDDDDLVVDERNPLWVMLNRDLPQRLAMAKKAARHQLPAEASDDADKHAARWQRLLSSSTGNDYTTLDASVSDTRVSPFLTTTWDQQTAYGSACYNYYTPPGAEGTYGNYPCGCVATAGAQLMRFHQYPTASVTAANYIIWIDGVSSNATMKGGTYSWSDMPANPNTSSTTLTQRQAIGKLTYDVGVACYMAYAAAGSGAYDFNLVSAFKNRFGYSDAVTMMNQNTGVMSSIQNAALSNLDAKYPVIFGISGSGGGHEVVGDGYGYTSGNLYLHLNMGWSGSYNAWYNLPTFTAYFSFTVLDSIIYNVFPTSTVEVVSGRVLDNTGAAVSGASVVATNKSTGLSAVLTDANGVYAFLVPEPSFRGATYQITASLGARTVVASATVRQSVSTTYSYTPSSGNATYTPGSGTVGNSWGNNLTLPDPAPDAPTGVSASDGTAAANVAISWSAATYAMGYGIYRYTSDNSASASWVGSASGTTYSDTSATPGTLYYYWIKATNTTGSSAFSASDSGYRLLSAPASVTAGDGASTASVPLSWATATGATGYNVYRYTADNSSSSSLLGSTSTTNYSDATASPGVLYYYWVMATNSLCASALSASESGYSALAAPASVIASDGASTSAVTIAWAATTNAAGYRVYRSATNTLESAAPIGGAAQTNYSDAAASPGALYTYWVKATNSLCASAFSLSNSGYRALCAPTNVIASESSTGAVTVTWGAVAGATYYGVYRSEGATGTKTALGGWQTALSYSDALAEPGTTYFYWVVAAVDASGTWASDYSEYDTGLRLVSVPLDVALDATNLVWTTGGSVGWFGQTNMTSDGVDAARSGALADGQTNWIQTAVSGRGTLTFWWSVSSESGADVLSFAVDGTNVWTASGTAGWTQQSVALGFGEHALTWAYSKSASGSFGADCGWVDQVSWSPATATATTPVPVPYAWLDAYGLGSAGDYEAAAHADADGDGYTAWQEYVAGTVPTNAASVFQARIGVSNGLPVVTWMPDLGTARVYTVEGKSALTNAAWLAPTNSDTRFFRVKVDVP